MNPSIRWQLFVMMALQFFVWGAWLPLVWPYMTAIGFDGTQQAWVGSAFAIASILAVFFGNQFVDRNFAAERFLACSHLIGGLAMLGLHWTRDFAPFLALMLVHSLFYVPTISVTNTVAFTHLRDPQREFGLVRMGGTIGWIAASWPLYFLLQDVSGEALTAAQGNIFLVAGIGSLAMSGYSLTLPRTPPKHAADGADRLAWAKAARLLRSPFLAVLYAVTLIDATIHAGYFKLTGGFLGDIGFAPEHVMAVMSVGQVAEIGTMAALGLVLAKLGWRKTLILGILGHAARFFVFAFVRDHAAIVAVQVLHGICYAFFFATVYIFIDAHFPRDTRTSAQGLFNLLILGIGDLLANWIFLDWLRPEYTDAATKAVDWQALFTVPAAMALGGALCLDLFFRPPPVAPRSDPAP
jgi:nucleoside transporter